MAARSVAVPPKLDVILLGKTGVGKSTTGNKLINADGNNAANQALGGQLKREWPRGDETNPFPDEPEVAPLRFDANDGTQSATRCCAVISNAVTGFRVMDTRGFAPSDVSGNVYRANLQIMREVVRVSTALRLTYNRILYFLPDRDIPTRADGYLQEELAVLWHFFGRTIFKNLVIVVTVVTRSKTKATKLEEEFGEDDAERLRRIFTEALANAIHRREDDDVPPCPPIVFIPPQASSDLAAEIVRNAPICEPTEIKLEFQKTTCCKCASVIHMRREEGGVAIAGVEIKEQKITAPEDTHCHPELVFKHSQLARLVGTGAHIAVLGVGLAIEHQKQKPVWPSFFWPREEMCANCKCEIDVKGCMKVGEMYQGFKVDHHHELMGSTQVNEAFN